MCHLLYSCLSLNKRYLQQQLQRDWGRSKRQLHNDVETPLLSFSKNNHGFRLMISVESPKSSGNPQATQGHTHTTPRPCLNNNPYLAVRFRFQFTCSAQATYYLPALMCGISWNSFNHRYHRRLDQ